MKNTITGYVIPNSKVESEYYHFDVHIVEYENGEDVEIFNETINDSQLFDIIQALGEISEEDDIEVDIYANYHGDRGLIEFYNELIDIFEKGKFHMEYEWGWDNHPLLYINIDTTERIDSDERK